MPDFRAHFDFDIRFANGGDLSGTGFRLDLPNGDLPAEEIGRLLVTCAPDNVGSNRAIVANGGVLARTAFVEEVQRPTHYYWIDLR